MKKPEAFDKWLGKQEKSSLKVLQANTKWSDLSSRQKTYYGIFLQLERKLRLVA